MVIKFRLKSKDIFIFLVFISLFESCFLFLPNYSINVDNLSPGLGSYSVSPDKDKYYLGEIVKITITPNEGSEFCGWWDESIDVIDSISAYITVDMDKYIFINFVNENIDYYKEFETYSTKGVSDIKDVYRMGVIDPDFEDFDNIKLAPNLNYNAQMSLKAKQIAFNYNEYPRPLSQGNQGSCVAWAVGFALKSYYQKKIEQWNLGYKNCSGYYSHNYSHVFSPAYIYNQLNGGEDNGIAVISVLDLLKSQGICTWDYMPYNENDYTSQPSIAANQKAVGYKIENYYKLNSVYGTFSNGEITNIKNYLADGTPVIITVIADSNLHYPTIKNALNEYVWKEKDIETGGHAMCAIGFDENYGLKVMNSWGAYWANNGFIWIDLDFFKDQVGTAAYIIEDN